MSEGNFMCPNCGNLVEDSNVKTCPNCTYDFSQLIQCNYIDKDKFCTITNKPCHIKGFDYEDCGVFIGIYHLNMSPDELLN